MRNWDFYGGLLAPFLCGFNSSHSITVDMAVSGVFQLKNKNIINS